MATTKKTKLKFNKFFPDSNYFVTVDGLFDPSCADIVEAVDLSLTIQKGLNQGISFHTWLHDSRGTLDQLKAIKEATEKAIKFLEDSTAAYKAPKPVVTKDKVIKGMKK